MSRQILPIHYHTSTCLSIVTLECTSPAKRFSMNTVNEKKFFSPQSLSFLIKLQHGLVRILNPFLLILFQHCISTSAEVLPLFLLFSRKIECNIKVKVHTNGMIAIHQEDSTVTIHPLKMRGSSYKTWDWQNAELRS